MGTMPRQIRAGVACVLVFVAGVVAVGSGAPAGACSFAGPRLELPSSVDAGGTLTVNGSGYFQIMGDLNADCTGNFEFVPLDEITVTVTFAMPRGPQTETQETTVRVDTSSGQGAEYLIGPLSFDVPADASAVTVSAPPAADEEVAVSTLATTTSTPPRVAPRAAPAEPVDGQASFTG